MAAVIQQLILIGVISEGVKTLDQQKNSQPVFHVREAREGSGGGRGLNACPDGLGKNLLDFGGMDTRIVFSEIKSPRVQILFGQCPNNGS